MTKLSFLIGLAICVLSFFPIILLGQEKITEVTPNGFVINLKFDEYRYSDTKKAQFAIRDYLDFMDESSPFEFKLPKKTLIVAIPPDIKSYYKIVDKNSIIEKNIIPQLNPSVSLSKKGELEYIQNSSEVINSLHKQNNTQNNVIVVKEYFWMRGFYCALLDIYPVAFNPSTSELETIKDLSIKIEFDKNVIIKNNISSEPEAEFDKSLDEVIYNYDLARSFIYQRNKKTDNSPYEWIDFNTDYLKIGVSTDGIYRIYKSDLEKYNINISQIVPSKFKLFLKGKEIPIYVKGEEDNFFDNEDFIEFYGTKNYAEGDYRIVNNLDKPYSEYIDRYSDTTIYWLTWSGKNGLRSDTINYFKNGITDTLYYYTEINHQEQNNWLDFSVPSTVEWQNPEWLYIESWIWGQQTVGTVNRAFNVSDFVNGKTAKAFFRVQSYASNLTQNPHDLGLSINNYPTIYDSGYIQRYRQKILYAEFPSNQLINGQNILKTYSYPVPNATINSIQVDWYEVEYPRYLKLFSDSLKFKFNQTLLDNDLYISKLVGEPLTNYILFKTDGQRRIENFYRLGNILYFADSIKSGDTYYITKAEKINKPVFYYKKRFENLLSPDIQADYILISHPAFQNTANEYINFIKNNYDVSAKYVSVIDIYDQFNFGFFSPEPIKTFLYNANLIWAAPKPSYVFLVGEANYDYHNYKKIQNFTPNYVPSFGYPVSDTWFVIWDSISVIPQMFIGRLPAKSEEEFQHYFRKHKKYLEDKYNLWNKSYLLLSGGKEEGEQLTQKSVNDAIKSELILPQPIGGFVGQLYATKNPPTNFGPFSSEHVDSLLNSGSVVISFIGHSGTKIWDNGIEDVKQLRNKFNKSSFITDFGCSTGKFAEPDIVSFSEAFTNGLEGDAIGYIGNSSLGFTSTSYGFPQIFYKEIYKNNTLIPGVAHLKSKINLLNQNGFSDVNRLFILTNSLLSDPIIELKIPQKPNLMIEAKELYLPDYIDDNLDSINIKVGFVNFGRANSDTFSLKLNDYLKGELVYSTLIQKQIPLNKDYFTISIPVKNLAGTHSVEIILDDTNLIDEIYEDDNSLTFNYNVLKSSVRTLISDPLRESNDGNFIFLNSVKSSGNDTLDIEITSDPDFVDFVTYKKILDTTLTKINFNNLVEKQRYWFRTSLTSNPSQIFETISFTNISSGKYHFSISDSISLSGFEIQNIIRENSMFKIGDSKKLLKIKSSGFETGGIANIEFDGLEYANNVSGCGFHNVVFNEADMKFEQYRWFNFWNDPNNYNAYAAWLNTIPEGKILIVSIGGSCGGYNISSQIKTLLHEFGSIYIDSVKSNTSFLLFGKKGTQAGTVPEAFSRNSAVQFDSTFIFPGEYGKLVTTKIDKVSKWNFVKLENLNIPNGTEIKIKPILFSTHIDTLPALNFQSGIVELNELNLYKGLPFKFLIEFKSGEIENSPTTDGMYFNFNLLPELTTNYQVASISKDSLIQGDSLALKFFVYNVGESPADSFKVKVELVRADNSSKLIMDSLVTQLDSMQRKEFGLLYRTGIYDGIGNVKFKISIDHENKALELYEDNNIYEIPFLIKKDTTSTSVTSATLAVTFDGMNITDGDYVSSKPEINFTLNYPVWFPVYDSTAVQFYLDNEQINFSQLNIYSDTINRKAVYTYKPVLSDGEHNLKVFGNNITGQLENAAGYSVVFNVSSEMKLMNVYNYPNPFKQSTDFTFILTQQPDELKIKIYTVAGRLIRDIERTSSLLNTGFNKIYWDGKDQDGNDLANGVYLYKVLVKKDDKTFNQVQKLAIVR